MAKVVAVSGETRTAPGWRRQPRRFWNFLKDVRAEMHKVVTPSRQEVRSTTAVVIVTVFLFAAYFYVVDTIFGHAIQALLNWLSH